MRNFLLAAVALMFLGSSLPVAAADSPVGDGFTTSFSFTPALPVDGEQILLDFGDDGEIHVTTTSYSNDTDGVWAPAMGTTLALVFYYGNQTEMAPATHVIDSNVTDQDGQVDWAISEDDLPVSPIPIVALAVIEQSSGEFRSSAYAVVKNLIIQAAADADDNDAMDLMTIADVLDGPTEVTADFWTPLLVLPDLPLPTGDGLVASFPLPQPANGPHDAGQDFTFSFEAFLFDAETEAWDTYGGPIDVFLKFDCGALAPLLGNVPDFECPGPFDNLAERIGTTDRGITITSEELQSGFNGLPLAGFHLFVQKDDAENPQTSHFLTPNEALIALGQHDLADAFEENGFSPILFHEPLPVVTAGDDFYTVITPVGATSTSTPLGSIVEANNRNQFVFNVCAYNGDGTPYDITDWRMEFWALPDDPTLAAEDEAFTLFSIGSYGDNPRVERGANSGPGCMFVEVPMSASFSDAVQQRLVQISFWVPFELTGKMGMYSETVNLLHENSQFALADELDRATGSGVYLVPRGGNPLNTDPVVDYLVNQVGMDLVNNPPFPPSP